MTLQDKELLFKRLKLKLGINKYLHRWGKEYATNVYGVLHCKDKPFFNSIVDEMEGEGMLTREAGRGGAVILVYRETTEVDSCLKS